jgi:phosphoribosylformylglycinamidine synthase
LRRFFDNAERVVSGSLSAWAVGPGGTAEAIVKMCLGNRLGFEAVKPLTAGGGFGGFVIETAAEMEGAELLGRTTSGYTLKAPAYEIPLESLQTAWERTLEPVYPCLTAQGGPLESFTYSKGVAIKPRGRVARPRFVIPVFPGTNSEYDTARAIEKAGGKADVLVVRNLTAKDIAESVRALADAIDSAQAVVIPGGFSGGDEPDGSGKFITAFFRNAAISGAVANLLQKRDGLMCGICNGFQALIKLGLVPYGGIRDMDESSPTLTFNRIGRHQSTLVRTRICSNKSPWPSHLELGQDYLVPISHGEGRFIASGETVSELAANGQIATQYVDLNGEPTQDIRFNPNGSDFAIEGITSPDGRVFGRMGHNERYDNGLFKNVPGTRKMDIFAGAVGYFK